MFKRFSLLLIILLILFFPSFVSAAAVLPIGTKCDTNGDCQSGDCEASDLKIDNNSFCVCTGAKDCGDTYGQQTGENWTCKDGITSTHDLHYCASDKRSPMYPLSSAEVIAAASGKDDAAPVTLDKPNLAVSIPGMTPFTDITVKPGDTASIPYLAQYIIALYRYAIILGSIIAVVMLMVGGILYLTAGGLPGNVSKAKEIIFGTLTGLILLLCSYLVLQIINPNLTKLNPISIETIKPVDYDVAVIQVFSNSAPDVSDQPPTTIGTPGKWRSQMLDPSLCGNNDNLSLSTTQRYDKLKQIINVWKTVGLDQGGALYVRGGTADCSQGGFGNEPGWFAAVLMAPVISHKTSIFSAEFTNDKCGKYLINDMPKSFDSMPGKNNYQKMSALKDNADFKTAISGCMASFRKEYWNLIATPAHNNGLLCGDCGSFLANLYGACFDKRIKITADVKTKQSSTLRFRAELKDMIKNPDTYTAKMKPGDIMAIGDPIKHYVMYTGKAGLPFDVMEMGGGGANDLQMSGVKLANKNAGTAFDVSAMRSTATAANFFKSLSSWGNSTIIQAWGVLDNPKFDQYIK